MHSSLVEQPCYFLPNSKMAIPAPRKQYSKNQLYFLYLSLI
ncbi:hypothetical protein FDUTEX481_08391 [Tolypothrix sp. PCC 7601]|nr:hypothetical protein FDUTEX481_08391 [Tolypothrix sp. PCC 7601]